jgi:hypothetical protein
MKDKSREVNMRRWAARLGLILRKSKKRNWSINDYGGYMIVNFDNCIEAGEKYDLTLDQVEAYLRDDETEKKPKQ